MSWAHGWHGVELIFSFGGCVLIVLLSKWFGQFIQRKEDYYDE